MAPTPDSCSTWKYRSKATSNWAYTIAVIVNKHMQQFSHKRPWRYNTETGLSHTWMGEQKGSCTHHIPSCWQGGSSTHGLDMQTKQHHYMLGLEELTRHTNMGAGAHQTSHQSYPTAVTNPSHHIWLHGYWSTTQACRVSSAEEHMLGLIVGTVMVARTLSPAPRSPTKSPRCARSGPPRLHPQGRSPPT